MDASRAGREIPAYTPGAGPRGGESRAFPPPFPRQGSQRSPRGQTVGLPRGGPLGWAVTAITPQGYGTRGGRVSLCGAHTLPPTPSLIVSWRDFCARREAAESRSGVSGAGASSTAADGKSARVKRVPSENGSSWRRARVDGSTEKTGLRRVPCSSITNRGCSRVSTGLCCLRGCRISPTWPRCPLP